VQNAYLEVSQQLVGSAALIRGSRGREQGLQCLANFGCAGHGPGFVRLMTERKKRMGDKWGAKDKEKGTESNITAATERDKGGDRGLQMRKGW
jgi:hypothetical protein